LAFGDSWGHYGNSAKDMVWHALRDEGRGALRSVLPSEQREA